MSDEEKISQTIRVPDETDDPAEVAYEEVLLDIPKDLILGAVETFAKEHLSEVSYTIVAEALKMEEDYETPVSYIFEKLGRAIFNEIVAAAIQMKLRAEEFEEVLNKLEKEWDGDTPSDSGSE